MKNSPPTIVVIAPLPPPIHGQSLVNHKVVEWLTSEQVNLKVVNTSPASLRRGAGYHIRRTAGVILAVCDLIRSATCKEKTLYLPLNAGLGVVYDFIIVAIARLCGYRMIIHHHASSYTLERSFAFRLLFTLSGTNTTHIALCDRMKADLREKYTVANAVVCGNACHIPSSDNSGNSSRNQRLTIGILSNLSRAKGLNSAIELVQALISEGVNAVLHIAGPAADADANETLSNAKLRLGDRVKIFGAVSGRAKDDFFDGLDIFLFPSRYKYEAQPLVLYEAMAHGLPVVTNNVGYISDMLINRAFVAEVDDRDLGGLTVALRSLASQDVRLTQARENSARFAAAKEESQDQFRSLCNLLIRSGV